MPNGDWVPARPKGFYSLSRRLSLAYKVFSGQCDALLWPEDSFSMQDVDDQNEKIKEGVL